jgi:hypothetical protein
MALLDADTLAALNRLLEDERAAVTIAAALINGATELAEREAFARMGGEQVLACCALRERLELAAANVSREIGGSVFPVLATERYDERLRAYAYHLSHLNERTQALLLVVTARETRRTLEDAYAAHAWAVAWCDRRAEEFTASRETDPRAARRTPLAAVAPQRATSEDTGANGDGLTRIDQLDATEAIHAAATLVENGHHAAPGADGGTAGDAASSDMERADEQGRERDEG